MKLYRIGIIVLTLLSMPVLSAGDRKPGYVDIDETNEYLILVATMNVRYNTNAAGSPYFYVNGYANSAISIVARDSNNTFFSCYIPTDSPYYNMISAIKSSLENGSRMVIYKKKATSYCEMIMYGQYSNLLD